MNSIWGYGRSTSGKWPWPPRPSSGAWKKLLVFLALVLYVSTHLSYFNSFTRRYKDCSVPWPTELERAQRRGGPAGAGAGGARERPFRIAVVSMATGHAADPAAAAAQAAANTRADAFAGLLALTGPNKRAYAARHGYTYVDASGLLDTSRPASWSKIPAVLSVLADHDWVFWMDADTLVTNLSQPLEALLPPRQPHTRGRGAAGSSREDGAGGSEEEAEGEEEDEAEGAGGGEGAGAGVGCGGSVDGSQPDLILTADVTGVNAGVWLVRGGRCSWASALLRRWWSLRSFVRRPGDTKSGDNDALKHLVASMPPGELSAHVGLAPQCAFNSYMWRPSLRNWMRYLRRPRELITGLWQPGDFVLHPAGVWHKREVLEDFIRRHHLAGPAASAPSASHTASHTASDAGAGAGGQGAIGAAEGGAGGAAGEAGQSAQGGAGHASHRGGGGAAAGVGAGAARVDASEGWGRGLIALMAGRKAADGAGGGRAEGGGRGGGGWEGGCAWGPAGAGGAGRVLFTLSLPSCSALHCASLQTLGLACGLKQ
ncbi:hypothetical protein HYH03_014330 [Edaphochlamys debaryana]|uniref:Uncharacterized protein n=1 Tax=Edaphochlamys debaryana TaxID=47281 RepID=A0A835XUE4_9CHLO|nr:hypothetical protein HYH03_014330 [Edaphochlamys debaryana]|eukprot:KAG2487085.1 hypothetical protein HYH03_014330 [Edaphochlamys debaryana]